MITGTLIGVALALGYGVTVLCSLAATFALAAASPAFVSRDFKLTAAYKWIQALLWLGSVTAGAFVTCLVARNTHPLAVIAVLAVVLIAMLWLNTLEARQRGMAHQILMSATTLAGAAAGYRLTVFFFQVRR